MITIVYLLTSKWHPVEKSTMDSMLIVDLFLGVLIISMLVFIWA